jgi:hypothetical protein
MGLLEYSYRNLTVFPEKVYNNHRKALRCSILKNIPIVFPESCLKYSHRSPAVFRKRADLVHLSHVGSGPMQRTARDLRKSSSQNVTLKVTFDGGGGGSPPSLWFWSDALFGIFFFLHHAMKTTYGHPSLSDLYYSLGGDQLVQHIQLLIQLQLVQQGDS